MTLREWQGHKASQESAGICAHCPFRRECDALRTDEDARVFVDGAVKAFVLDLALTLAALEPEARA